MEAYQDAHFFKLPSQGNIYTNVSLPLSNGTKKTLVGILKRKVFCCEFVNDRNGTLVPVVTEVPFTYIPGGAEIISMDAFNRSSERDDFFIGISIIKVISEENTETYLNIYSEQDEEKTELNMESIAHNCLILKLSYVPFHLYHANLVHPNSTKEIVWLLSGSDMKVHLFREDPLQHTYGESEIDGLFPEFDSLESILFWMDIKYTPDQDRRLTAYGCQCGITKLVMVDVQTSNILREFKEYYDAPISRVELFAFQPGIETDSLHIGGCQQKEVNKLLLLKQEQAPVHLLVVNTLRAAAIFMDVEKNGLRNKNLLPDSDKFDAPLTCCIADIDLDGIPEILIGTFSQMMLVYKFNTWQLISKFRFSHAIHSISYTDLSSDGVKELLVVTISSIHILQHKPVGVLELFNERLDSCSSLVNSAGDVDENVDA